jgi:hypothetical protein
VEKLRTSMPVRILSGAYLSRRTSQRFLREVRRRFFRILFSRLSRRFSTRTWESSICSVVACRALGPLSLPASNALTQLRSVCSISPSSFATAPAVWPACLHPLHRQLPELRCILVLKYFTQLHFSFQVGASYSIPWMPKFQRKLIFLGEANFLKRLRLNESINVTFPTQRQKFLDYGCSSWLTSSRL